MLLGIISDTHDQLARTRAAVELLRRAGAEAIVHCGDLTGPPIVEAIAELSSWFVFGNNDVDAVIELRQAAVEFGSTCLGWGGTFDFGGHRVGVTHGHSNAYFKEVLAKQPEFLLYGHFHDPSDETIGSVRRINPGALYRAKEYTAAILDPSSGQLKWLQIPK